MPDERKVITKETVKADLLKDLKSETRGCILDVLFFLWIPLVNVFWLCEKKNSYFDVITAILNVVILIASLLIIAFLFVAWYRAITTMNLVKKTNLKLRKTH